MLKVVSHRYQCEVNTGADAYRMCWSVTTLTFRCRTSVRFLANRTAAFFRLGGMAKGDCSDACGARQEGGRSREEEGGLLRCYIKAEARG